MYNQISSKLSLPANAVRTVLKLLEEGATIPFIARYRKDQTGGLDEVAIAGIQEEAKNIDTFNKRRDYILETIESQGKLTDALKASVMAATDTQQLEDLYLPYKQRKKTRADMAHEAGLEPLAAVIYRQKENNPQHLAKSYCNDKIKNTEDALQGARDIIAEWINENIEVRNSLRERFKKHGMLQAKLVKSKEQEGQKYKDYFNYSERLERCPSHRIMAVFRGVDEGILRYSIEPDQDMTLDYLERKLVKFRNSSGEQVQQAIADSYKRLLQPSLETEFKNELWNKAEQQAINVFAENLKQLLLSAPLGPKRILAIDPGIRTGCKLVCLDEKGSLLKSDVIYIHEGRERSEKAQQLVRSLCSQYRIQAVAIGDGTAGRETDQFIKSLQLDLPVFLVNEDGASVYSASETAREEFPKEDITVRGTVSIGRRLMDPLAELVKIDPKAIGVGQYQHDVNPGRLKEKLDQTVVNCVNQVGVNLNTASKHLLSYVSGLGPALAQNIIEYRNKAGKFTSRTQLKEVPRLGNKAFEQCAGFLRIKDGDNPLDASGVHPEHYKLVNTIARDAGLRAETLIGNEQALKQIDITKYISAEAGALTLKDIISELQKPGLDPREEASVFQYAADIHKIEDLRAGMVVPGIISNITQFGAFVDIGVKQDGLVHISHLANRFVKDPNEVVKLNQKVIVKILEVDYDRKRVALSMKEV